MFSFFNNEVFQGFWGNEIGELFFEATCKSLKWDIGKIDLVYYPSLDSAPIYYEFDSNKILTIKEKIVSYEEKLNELGEPVLDENGAPVIEKVTSFSVVKTIDPEVYVSKGITIKPC